MYTKAHFFLQQTLFILYKTVLLILLDKSVNSVMNAFIICSQLISGYYGCNPAYPGGLHVRV